MGVRRCVMVQHERIIVSLCGLLLLAVASTQSKRLLLHLAVTDGGARGLYLEGEISRVNMVMSNIILVVVRLSVLVVESGQLFSPRYP